MTTFREFVDRSGVRQADVARACGLTPQQIHRAYHDNRASPRTIAAIRDWSGGEVTFDSFYPPSRQVAAE